MQSWRKSQSISHLRKTTMNDPRTSYLLFIRPLGSSMWTQVMNQYEIFLPWASYVRETADEKAMEIANEGRYCVRVVPVKHKREMDSSIYAILSDQETKYKPTP